MKTLLPFQPCTASYEKYYMNQAGHGLQYFQGKRHQRGRGFLNLISRAVVPLLKSGGKALLKQGLNTGMKVIGDVMSGEKLSSSVKKRSQQAGKRLFNQAMNQAVHTLGASPMGVPAPPLAKRIKADKIMKNLRRRKRAGRGRTKQNSGNDIFG